VTGPQSHPWATDAPQKQVLNPYPWDAKDPLKATLRDNNSLLFIERKVLSP
jgi:pyruvate/2-oxoglutarate/acetoin dehydrogenase E1 component